MTALRKLKIAMIAVQHGAYDDRIFYKEARFLVKRGHDVVILFAGKEHMEETRDGVKIRCVAPRLSPAQKVLKKVFRGKFYASFLTEALSEKADIYVAHEPQSVVIALKAAKTIAAIPVFDSHESLKFSNQKDLFALKHHIPSIQHFLAVNAMVADDILKVRPDADIQIVRNASIFKASEQIEKESLTICFEGSLSFDRGLKEMCALFIEVLVKRELAVKFKVIGELYGAEKDFYTGLLAENPSLDAVQFTGWKDYEDVQAELECGSIGLIMNHKTPNNEYSSPNKLFNYIACNMCVLSVDLPFITDLVRKYENGIIIETLDPIHFADAIEKLVHNKAMLLSFCEKSKTAHGELNWERESHKLIEFLEQISASKEG